MIEFADPALVACLGTFGGAMLLKGIDMVCSKRKAPEVKRMTFKEIADSEPVNPVVCSLWDQRRFEQELVEAGIETELSVCENKECRDCYPVLKKPLPTPPPGKGGGSPVPTIAPDTVRRRDTHAIEVACSNCQDVFWFTGERGPATFICSDCREAGKRNANAYSREEKEYAAGEDKDEQCFKCDYSEIEVDQLLDAAVVFRSEPCSDHQRVDFMGYRY